MVDELKEDPAPLVRDIEAYTEAIREFTGSDMLRLPAGFTDGLARHLIETGYIRAGSRHVAQFSLDEFGLQHPAECRPNLLACPVGKALNALDASPVEEYGHYVVTLDDGVLVVGERIQ